MLKEIAESVRYRLAREMAAKSLDTLMAEAGDGRKPFDFAQAFRGEGFHVIAEVKLASPSEGDIAPKADPVKVAGEYLANGAVALSVLTEPEYFKGRPDYLKAIRQKFPQARILMKDFVVDEYQLAKAWALGADACLLIVALLGEGKTGELLRRSAEYGLTALVEVHDRAELDRALALGARLVGINNRNLRTFDVSLATCEDLAPLVPADRIVVGESGISTPGDVARLERVGIRTVLVGESLMRQADVAEATRRLLAPEMAASR